MAYRELELTLLSARDLKNVNLITRMDVYAVVSISGDPLTRQCTAPDPSGGRNPCWHATLRFSVPPTAAAAAGGCVHVLLRAERVLGDRDVGEVVIPLAELLAAGAPTAGPQLPQLASYQVRKVHRGEPRGVLNVSYRFGPVVAPVEPPEKKPAPVVMAYPVAVGAPSTQPPRHPPGDAYPPRPAAAVRTAEKHEHSPSPAPAPSPPPRNGKSNDGPGRGGPTQVCVGPHTQIFLGGGGGPTGPGTAMSPTGSNASPRKADGGWPTKQQHDIDTRGGGAYYASAAQPMVSPRKEDRSRPNMFSQQHDTQVGGFFQEMEATSHREPAAAMSPLAPSSRRPPPASALSSRSSSSSSSSAHHPFTLSPCSSGHSSSASSAYPSTTRPSPRPPAATSHTNSPRSASARRSEATSFSPVASSPMLPNHYSGVMDTTV